MNEAKLRKQGYIRIDKFCHAMDTWAQVCQQELPADSEYRLRWRKEFSVHWQFEKDRLRREILRSLPSNGDLGRLRQAHHSEVHRLLEQSLQVQEAVRRMDEWTRKVWAARQYGYSWSEIAEHLDLTEPQAKPRFRYAIGKLRALFSRGR
jgi:DNA-directed RNA polymerase specialized sigma24 family protein